MKEEESLIKKAQKGHGESFGKLYDLYMPRIFRFIVLKVGTRQDAEDLTQQVFVNAWRHIHSFEFQGFPFSSWLYRIASNAVIDHYRTSRPTYDIEKIPEEIIAQTVSTNRRRPTSFRAMRSNAHRSSDTFHSLWCSRLRKSRPRREYGPPAFASGPHCQSSHHR